MYIEFFTELIQFLLFAYGMAIISQILGFFVSYFLGILRKYWKGKVKYCGEENQKKLIVKEDDKDDKDDKQKHVQFESTFQISSDINVQKENLQQATKSNAVGAIIHKKQEDQGWMQGHHQQKLLAQCKQRDMIIAEIDSIKSLLKSRLTQKQMKFDQLQGNHITVTQDQTATCDSSSNEIEMLKQQFGMMQEQFMHLERRLQSLCEFEVHSVRQFKELHRAFTNLDHLSKNPHRHEQELQNGDKKSSAVHLEMIQIQEENERLEDMQRTQKNGQIDDLQSDLIKAKVESLQRDASNHSSFTERLQDDLEALRLKNNNEAIGACSSLDQSVNGPSSECTKPE